VLEDPWDMTEASPCTLSWHTYDIVQLVGYSTFTDSISGMFEGVLDDPSDSNLLELRVSSTERINTTEYHMLSLAGLSDDTLDITLGWMDVNSTVHRLDIGESLGPDWAEIGPVDLSALIGSVWTAANARRVWLELDSENDDPVRVRLGWVKLTNGEE